jgi:hypothetical protein
LRGVALDAVVEDLDEFGLAAAGLAERPHLQLVTASEHAGDGDDAVQMMRHEVAPGLLAAGEQCHFGQFGCRQRRLVDAVDGGEPGDVGNCFNVENQGGMHGAGVQAKAAILRCHCNAASSVEAVMRASR